MLAMTDRLSVLGVSFDPVSRAQVMDRIAQFLASSEFHQVVTVGTEMVMHAQHDLEFRRVTNQAALVVPDGIGVVAAGRYCGYQVPDRVTGVDLTVAMATHFGPRARFFFLGGGPGVAEEAAAAVRHNYPGAQVVGIRDGYFKDDQEVVDQIRQSGANILLVGVGFPRQELWLEKHGPLTGCCVGMGVGGTFDVLSGRLRRAPEVFRRLGLEWLYRLMKQPQRWRRMLVLPKFAWIVATKGRATVVRVLSESVVTPAAVPTPSPSDDAAGNAQEVHR